MECSRLQAAVSMLRLRRSLAERNITVRTAALTAKWRPPSAPKGHRRPAGEVRYSTVNGHSLLRS